MHIIDLPQGRVRYRFAGPGNSADPPVVPVADGSPRAEYGRQDSFVSPPHAGVTWLSRVSLAATMSAGILFGFAGRRVLTSGN
jgi:hypothetical protein